MDKLYIGDIPEDFHYAQFGNDYITLYNKESLRNENAPYYRIYFNYNGFFYSTGTTTFGNNTTVLPSIGVTSNPLYRSDISNICVVSFIIIFVTVFLINLITSCFKKGGVFGGLL